MGNLIKGNSRLAWLNDHSSPKHVGPKPCVSSVDSGLDSGPFHAATPWASEGASKSSSAVAANDSEVLLVATDHLKCAVGQRQTVVTGPRVCVCRCQHIGTYVVLRYIVL